MTPERDRKLRELMGEAPLGDLAPGFDKDGEWELLSARLHEGGKRRVAFSWAYAAAIVVLLACVGFVVWNRNETHQHVAKNGNNVPAPPAANNGVVTDTQDNNKALAATSPADTITKKQETKVIAVKKQEPQRVYASARRYQTKEIICNGTPCPIQICISQTMKCPNTQPKPISTCATLESDESVKLDYKEHHEVAKNCSVTVDEIEIKSVATGETIILNSSSAPYTAQDVFSYIKGEKKGDIMAGVFRHDCDQQNKQQGLRLDNSYGDMIIRQ